MKSKSLATVFLWLASATAGCGSSTTSGYVDACDDPITDDECYALRRDPASEQVALATDIALRYIEEHPATLQEWDWTSGVLMFGLTELYRVTGDAWIRDYYQEYLDYHIGEGYELIWSDSCPPALTALALLREMENPAYRQVVDDVLEYLQNVPRTEEGGINHLGTFLADPPAIWVDSLFMFGMVLNRHGESADDANALDLMSSQLEIFAQVLQSDSGLMVHADDWLLDFDTDIYWARGNAWVVASLADYLRIRFLRNESDPNAERVFQAHVDGALATFDANSGQWWTVMNRPGQGANYLETSSGALFAYGMARAYRYGLLGQRELETAKRAVAALKDKVQNDGEGRPVVTGISVGTSPSTFEGYVEISVESDISYGVGIAILALIETSGL